MHFQLSLLKNRYPESEKSAGDILGKTGDINNYDAIRPVREMFINSGLEASIRNLLNNRATELHYGEKTHEILKYGIFMMGKTPQKSHPTIMLCCRTENPRRRAKKMILNERILDEYVGFKLRTCDESTSLVASQNMEVTSASEDAESQSQIMCRRSRLTEDRRIFIKTHSEPSTLRKASCGKLLQIQGEHFYTTVSHAFTSSTISAELQTTNESNINSLELRLDSDSDTDEDNFVQDIGDEEEDYVEFIDATSLGSLTPEYADSETDSDTKSDTFPQSKFFDNQDDENGVCNNSNIFSGNIINNAWYGNIMPNQVSNHHDGAFDKHLCNPRQSAEGEQLSVLGEQHLSSKDGPNPNLDYTLIKVSEDEADRLKDPENGAVFKVILDQDQSWVIQAPDRIVVTATTGSGNILSGKLLSTPTFFMLPGSIVFQEVWTMQHNGTLLDGDCGSCVFDAKNGKLVGHIVAGSHRASFAYIIPFRYIIADIGERFGREFSLLNTLSSLTEQNSHENTCHIDIYRDSMLSCSNLSYSLDEGPDKKVEDKISLKGESNLGVVTKTGVNLMHAPSYFMDCTVSVPNEDNLGVLVGKLSRLERHRHIENHISVANLWRQCTVSGQQDIYARTTFSGSGVTDPKVLAEIQKEKRWGYWKGNKIDSALSISRLGGIGKTMLSLLFIDHLQRKQESSHSDQDYSFMFWSGSDIHLDHRNYAPKLSKSLYMEVLLHHQSKLTDFEARLRQLQQRDAISRVGNAKHYARDWRLFSLSHTENSDDQVKMVNDIKSLLKEYNEPLIQAATSKFERYCHDLEGTSKEGVFQVANANMDLSRFHRVHSRSNVDPFSGPGSPSYVLPEFGFKFNISCTYDVWSLPCVFLEFMTWDIAKKPREFEGFATAREKAALVAAFIHENPLLRVNHQLGLMAMLSIPVMRMYYGRTYALREYSA